MPYQCTHCGLYSEDGNTWCQRVECSSTFLARTIRQGEFLDDIEIKRVIRANRNATFYKAQRNDEPLILKVSHEDTTAAGQARTVYADLLRAEARNLFTLNQQADRKRFPHRDMIPQLLPPYSSEAIDPNEPYGEIMFRDRLMVYIVMPDYEGRFLRDLLDDNPQPAVRTVLDITSKLIALLRFMQSMNDDNTGIHHWGLTPESLFIRFDHQGYWRPILMDLGIMRLFNHNPLPDLSRHIAPAYTAPEILRYWQNPHARQPIQPIAIDVYGVSLLLYEMLMGQPAIPYKVQTQKLVERHVLQADRRITLNRVDVEPFKPIIEHGLASNPAQRPDKLSWIEQAFVKQNLYTMYGEVPEETEPQPWYHIPPRTREILTYVVIVVLLLLLGLVVAPEVTEFRGAVAP